ncbi:MAG: leucine-rich repeat domain-containing protein [Bacteroidetes bacterium]|nr:MAG: leucine-rich repeat domain-containing protein [Bacteroidota bacterium]
MTAEFENLLRLLSSTEEPNVRLGFQLARNYEAEFEAHFGRSRQEMDELFEFLMEHKVWDFELPFWEVTHLDLKGKRLQTLPTIIRHLQHLISLDLGNNCFQSLPVDMDNIEFLYIPNNEIESLPSGIHKLKKLKYLDVSHNKITKISSAIGSFMNLEYLKLSNNQLQKIPTEISNLTRLSVLDLRHNPLELLYNSLCNLQHTKINILGTPENIIIPKKLKQMEILVRWEH